MRVQYESYTAAKDMEQESDIAVVGTKGQIVIPQRFRKELQITPKTKLLVYRKDDKLVITKLKVPLLEELKELFKEIDNQNKERKTPSEHEILDEINLHRCAKRQKTIKT